MNIWSSLILDTITVPIMPMRESDLVIYGGFFLQFWTKISARGFEN